MKRAVIVVGSHHVGKSRTINGHLKPLLGMRPRARFFRRNGRSGCVLSQSFEESRKSFQDTIQTYSSCDYLVLAARPENERTSHLRAVRTLLQNLGFQVNEVRVQKSNLAAYYDQQAASIVGILDSP